LTLDGLASVLNHNQRPEVQADITHGMFAALNGRRDLKAPQDWPSAAAKLKANPDASVREEAIRLSLIFGDSSAITELTSQVSNPAIASGTRNAALEGLAQTKRPELVPVIKRSLADPQLRGTAIRALAAYDDPETPKLILDEYSKLKPEE